MAYLPNKKTLKLDLFSAEV